MSDDPKGKVREQFDDVRAEVEKMAGEIRVKMHLAGMDAKDKWREIEPQLHELESRAEKATEKVSHELEGLAKDLRARMRRLRDDLRSS